MPQNFWNAIQNWYKILDTKSSQWSIISWRILNSVALDLTDHYSGGQLLNNRASVLRAADIAYTTSQILLVRYEDDHRCWLFLSKQDDSLHLLYFQFFSEFLTLTRRSYIIHRFYLISPPVKKAMDQMSHFGFVHAHIIVRRNFGWTFYIFNTHIECMNLKQKKKTEKGLLNKKYFVGVLQ